MPHLLCKLLAVAVSDVDPEIRLVVLHSLETRFDPYLASPECLCLLFTCLNDEVPTVSVRSPAPAHPRFRDVVDYIWHSGGGGSDVLCHGIRRVRPTALCVQSSLACFPANGLGRSADPGEPACGDRHHWPSEPPQSILHPHVLPGRALAADQ